MLFNILDMVFFCQQSNTIKSFSSGTNMAWKCFALKSDRNISFHVPILIGIAFKIVLPDLKAVYGLAEGRLSDMLVMYEPETQHIQW